VAGYQEVALETDLPLILLIEDNESHALLITRGLSLSKHKHRLFHVNNGESALDYLFKRGEYIHSVKPRMILLDLRLPRVDGLDVLKEIKKTDLLQFIPVIILTSSMAEPDIERAYLYGANSYLVKPLDFSEFREEMASIADYWLGWNIHAL
jgi:CheY-like chemotaxis protein